MSFRRLLSMLVLAVAMAIVFVPGASAGNFDEEKMGCAGENPATCAEGRVGQPYSLAIYVIPPNDGRGEDFGCLTFAATSGSFPPGLSISDEGYIAGTPTNAGTYEFYLTATMNKEAWCAETCGSKCTSDDNFIIKINPGAPVLPKLIIGPEQSGVRAGTVGTPYMLAMTSNLSDAKTWSIASGALPPGVTIGASDGVISGMPGAAGSYTFTVQAAIADGRNDTKSLTIEVRDPLTITRSGDLEPRIVRTEVGVEFDGGLTAAGGFGAYTWSVEGDVPAGLTVSDDGTISGAPEESGSYRFNVVVTDAESRRAAYPARMVVAPRLAITSRVLAPGKVGRFMSRKVATVGGVRPTITRLKRGPLPPGIRFDRLAGIFVGSPTKVGTWRVRVEVVDSLGVRAAGIVVFVVRK